MMTVNSRAFFFSCFAFLCLLAFPFLSVNAAQKALEKTLGQSIVIKSDSLEIDNQKRLVTFTGHVDARTDDLTITCEKLFLHYAGSMQQDPSQKGDVKVEKVIARGMVKITRPDGGVATAEEAVYLQNEAKVILTGKPQVKQGDDFVEGSTITLFLNEDRSVVEGSDGKQVRAVISSGAEKREKR
jgi:lipopolysaccharide export system protein LptA